MDPITMIVAALAAGAATGFGDAASQSVKDAYEGLKGLIKRRFAGNPRAESALADHEEDPDTYEKPLAKQLQVMSADRDEQILVAARQLLEQVEVSGVSSKYRVQVSGDVGIIGDHGRIDRMKG